jgi:hypothetical protein
MVLGKTGRALAAGDSSWICSVLSQLAVQILEQILSSI